MEWSDKEWVAVSRVDDERRGEAACRVMMEVAGCHGVVLGKGLSILLTGGII